MKACPNTLAIKVYIFHDHPTRRALMLGKGVTVNFRYQDGFLCGSVWGCEKPLHIRLKPVEEVSCGFQQELGFKTTLEVPVRQAAIPGWIVIYNPPGYAAVMVPFNPGYRPPRRMWLRVEDYSETEMLEARSSCLQHGHLAFIDFVPHKVPPPRPHAETELCMARAA